MKSFKTFIEESASGRKYVSVIYDDETQIKLRNWCKENGFDLSKTYNAENQDPSDFKFHTTIFYSENESIMKNEILPLVHGEAFPLKFKLLGDNQDIPVLLVSSGDLNDLRDEYERKGLKDKWPDFLPHISLSYVRKDYDLSGLKLPEFRMKFGELKIEDIDEDV
jgi:2'-5' RNA ligase